MIAIATAPLDLAGSVARWGGRGLRRQLRALLDEPTAAGPALGAGTTDARSAGPSAAGADALGERFAALLEQSSRVARDDGAPDPVLGRLLEQLSPDGARVLRLLAEDGPQPMLDVRVREGLRGGERTVLADATMAVREAGVRTALDPAVLLDDLRRLGIATACDEPLPGDGPYEVLEAQPEVALARRVGRARLVRKRLVLTPLGRDLARAVGLAP